MRTALLLIGLLLTGAVHAELFDQPIAADAPALQTLANSLQQPLIRASYQQSRQLRLLKRPLLSSGEMVIVPGQALLLSQQQPLAQRLLLMPGQIAEIGDDGSRQPLAAGEGAVMEQLAPVLIAMLSGDWPTLAQEFDLFFQPAAADQPWQLGLHPKADWLRQALGEIVLSGQANAVERVTIRAGAGDLTDMVLTPLAATPLTAEESRALAP